MRRFSGRGRSHVTWVFSVLAGCLLPEVYSAPREGATDTNEASAVASDPPGMMSEPPPSDFQTMLDGGLESQAEAGGAGGSAGAVGTADEAAATNVPSAGSGGAPSPNRPCFSCDGVFVRRCDDAPTAKPIAECTSAILCDANAGKCLLAICAPNTATCKNNVLSKCNPQGTAYEDTVCGSRICSAAHGGCDLCAEYQECDGDILIECDATGQSYKRTPCPPSFPYCRQNRCVECVRDTDCPIPSNSCWHSYCELGQKACKVTNESVNASCTLQGSGAPGFCDSTGDCAEERQP